MGAGHRVRAVLRGQRPAAGPPGSPGRGDRLRAGARRPRAQFFRDQPEPDDARLAAAGASTHLAGHPAGKSLFDERHNPLYRIADLARRGQGADRLLAPARRGRCAGPRLHRPGAGTPASSATSTRTSPSTRKKTYALLQTPDFVEEFILDRTLDAGDRRVRPRRAQADRPDLRLGPLPARRVRPAVRRVAASASRARDAQERVRRALDAVRGVDINPFAVAIARFRLTGRRAAAPAACTPLADAPELRDPRRRRRLAAHGDRSPAARLFDDDETARRSHYATEDLARAPRHPQARPVPRRGRQPAVHHGQGQGAQRGATASVLPTLPPASTRCRCRSPSGSSTSPMRGEHGERRGLRRADHGQLVHEARVRQEADRGVLRRHEVDLTARHRHLRGLHPRPRHADRDPRRPPSPTAAADDVRAVLGVRGEPGAPDDPREGSGLARDRRAGRRSQASRVEWVSVADLPRARLGQPPVESVAAAARRSLKQSMRSSAPIAARVAGSTSALDDASRGEDDVLHAGRSHVRGDSAAESPCVPISRGRRRSRLGDVDDQTSTLSPYDD